MQLELKLFDRCADTFKIVEADKFGVDPKLECGSVGVCCGRRTDWSITLRKSRGYDLPLVEKLIDVPSLPKVIHSIKGDQRHFAFLRVLGGATWAVPYSRALAGDLENKKRLKDWLRHQKLASEKLVLLHQETQDVDLERLYPKTFHQNFFNIIGSAPNCVSISPGYSVYDDGSMCRHHQLYNLKRSLEFFQRACDNNIPCIPSLGWNLREDMDRIADWLNLHPTLRCVAINCQTIRADRFAEVANSIHYIEAASRSLRWVVFGGPKVSEYLNANGFAGKLHLVTTAHVQAAHAGRSLDVSYHPRDQVDLFVHNYKMVTDTFGKCNAANATSAISSQ